MSSLKDKLNNLENVLRLEAKSIKDTKGLEEFKIRTLGKKSELYQLSRSIGELPAEERKTAGALINQVKNSIENLVLELETVFQKEESKKHLASSSVDTTMPGRYIRLGSIHPVTQVLNEIIEIFKPLGYSIADGPEIEHEFYNFDALNIPKDHPARDMQDTFYISEEVVLRTHTSPIQARTMMQNPPPVRVLAPGKVYRSDYDLTHTPMFHQIEGLYVDKNVKFSHLKGTLLYFAKRMFGEKTSIRLRPSYFPFTEPSAEVDVTCVACKGKGCRICKNTGWLEILGCGMVNPNVFKQCGYSEELTGFAFGMGIERIAMLKYKINDLRSFFEGDVRFLRQFL